MIQKKNKPNILLLMVDQMTVKAMSSYGNSVARMPNIDHLAEESVVFENAYCASPLCAPARFSLLTGRQSVNIDAFDNASEFPAKVPTLAHYLRRHGYWSTLCGKMHFIGPDQMHGFNERTTTDVYPSTFGWVPRWDKGASHITSGVTCASILEAAPCVRSMQMDYDDEVEFRGIQKLFDLARSSEQQPFFLTISFTQPHHPFTISREYWDRYEESEIDMPTVAPIPFEELDYHSRGLYFAHGRHLHEIQDEHVRNARHAYYGMLSYLDDKVGRILGILDETGFSENTIVVFTSDHGEMLGERGMWHKHHFFEPAVRVPLMFRLPGEFEPTRIPEAMSHTDVVPTLLDYLGDSDHQEGTDGTSVLQAFSGNQLDQERIVSADYLAIGPCVPCRMVRKGSYKYMYTHNHDERMFNVDEDPHELENLADSDQHLELKDDLNRHLRADWDPDEVDARVRVSQRRRIAINESPGVQPQWDFVYRKGDEARFVRNSKVDATKSRYRLPLVKPVPPNKPPMSEREIGKAMQTGKIS